MQEPAKDRRASPAEGKLVAPEKVRSEGHEGSAYVMSEGNEYV